MQHHRQVLGRGRDEVDDILVEGGEADPVALAMGEVGQAGGEIAGVVELGELSCPAGEVHRAGDVEEHAEVSVGVRLELLEVEAIGAGKESPVDAADVVPGHVRAVLGEIH